MSDRTFRAALASAVAVVSLVVLASAAGAEDKPAEPKPVRHADLEVGVGVHWGTAKNTPIDDDFYANAGVAVPFTPRLDGEFQVGYFTGNDNPRHDKATEPKTDARNGA